MTQLSIVGTLYLSSPYLGEFCRRVAAAAERITTDYELVLVNDGSPDDSLAIACEAAARDPRVVVVDLSRNFGHHQAVMAGLAHARGRFVFLIDTDLEERPEWLGDFWNALAEGQVDAVFGVQDRRQGSWFARWSGAAFYKLFNLLSETRIPENACTVRLMTRTYVGALLSLNDQNLFLAANFAWAGFRQRALPVEKQMRRERSTYTFFKRLRLLLAAVTSSTSYPLYAVFFFGSAISLASGLFGGCLVLNKLLDPGAILLGWSSVMASIWFLGGLTIGAIGVIGAYLSRIFNECKPRPPYLVRSVFRAERPRREPLEPASNGAAQEAARN